MADQIRRTDTMEIDNKQSQINYWGKLMSLNQSKVKSEELVLHEVSIGRTDKNTIKINDNRLSSVHCVISFDPISKLAKIKDVSTNGTFLANQKIGKGNDVILKSGDEIFLLHKSKVPVDETLGFVFFQQDVQDSKINQTPTPQEDQEQKKKLDQFDQLSEEFHCPICDDLIFQAVTLIPCLHNFCGSCFSDWMTKQKTCPNCRQDCEAVKKNATINNVIEKYLNANPEKKRPDDEYKMMQENNKIQQEIIKFNNTNQQPKQTLEIAPPAARGRGRGRGRGAQQQQVQQQPRQPLNRQISDYSASSDEDTGGQTNCLSCKKAVKGFKCQINQKHVWCVNCRTQMPDRNLNQEQNEEQKHKCQICGAFFCSFFNLQCQKKSRQRMLYSMKNIPIPNNLAGNIFRGNVIEYQILREYMTQHNYTTKRLFNYMIENSIKKGLFRFIISNRIQSNNTENINIVMNEETPICNNCVDQVWFQLVFRFRIAIKSELPLNVRNRSLCWYGINCTTMAHNQNHAQKLDHIQEQTKF